jgi:hypothetical protein
MSYKDCEMNDKLTDADVAPLSDTNTNHHEGSNDSFPVSRSILATSIDGVWDNEAKFSVSFKVCPKILYLKSTKKSL